jgi:hypothetical protein
MKVSTISNLKINFICFLFSLLFLTPFYFWASPFVLTFFSLLYLVQGIFIFYFFKKIILPKVQVEFWTYPLRWRWFLALVSLISGIWLTLNIRIPIPPLEQFGFLPPLVVRLMYLMIVGIDIGIIVLLLVLVAARKVVFLSQKESQQNLFPFLKYWMAMTFVWGIFLLAFYPGIMTSDSIDQWNQMLTGSFNDHHPVFHTLTIWLLTRVALTPTTVAVAQILFLGYVTAKWFEFFENIGLSRWIIWISLFIFTLSPVNGTMVNTLWKDVPFSISVSAITLFLVKIVFSQGSWIQSWKSKILFGLVSAFILLFRHDGLPIGMGVLASVFLFYPQKFKHWIVTITLCLGFYFGVRGPLYEAVGVQKSTLLMQPSLSLYSIAGYAKNDSQASLIIQSFKIISPDWDCNIAGQINPEWRTTDLDYTISPIQIMTNLISRMPRVLIYFYRCERSMEWIVWDPNGEMRDASYMKGFVVSNPFGISHDSKIPWLRDIIADWVLNTSRNPSLNWFTWRPAFFLYLNLFVSLTLILRNRSLKFSLISLPILIQSVTFSLIFANPNFRYHYPVLLVSLISWPLLFSAFQFVGDESKK